MPCARRPSGFRHSDGRKSSDPRDKISATPDPEVYRFDGTETTVNRHHHSFRLVADALALTEKLMSGNGSGSFTLNFRHTYIYRRETPSNR
jgi:hypothetical protein